MEQEFIMPKLPPHFSIELRVEQLILNSWIPAADTQVRTNYELSPSGKNNEIRRRIWLIEGAVAKGHDLSTLMKVYWKNRRINTVPQHYLYSELLMKKLV